MKTLREIRATGISSLLELPGLVERARGTRRAGGDDIAILRRD
jgi:hypothetical protein